MCIQFCVKGTECLPYGKVGFKFNADTADSLEHGINDCRRAVIDGLLVASDAIVHFTSDFGEGE